ncbi:MAG TPA: hypothetical protein VFS34_06485 [Thermoanaerobaculia bacterium]|nr:hypothetical protein [Thermoanaerobaculia bacterium]
MTPFCEANPKSSRATFFPTSQTTLAPSSIASVTFSERSRWSRADIRFGCSPGVRT